MWHQRSYACSLRMNRAAALIWWVLRVRVRCTARKNESAVPGVAIAACTIASIQPLSCNKSPRVFFVCMWRRVLTNLTHSNIICEIWVGYIQFSVSAAILNAILNISENSVISFVSITFLNHKSVCLALEISVLSAIQSEIFNFLFSAAMLDAILNVSAHFVMWQHIVFVPLHSLTTKLYA